MTQCMKRLLLCVALAGFLVAPPRAEAGESKYLGVITVSGASLTNATTAVPFVIPPGSKVTLSCSAAVQVLTDSTVVATTGANKGLPVAASTNFPTSVGSRLVTIGGQPSALIAVIGTGACDVWQRSGGE